MALRLKLELALVAASLLGVTVSFAITAILPDSVFAGVLAAALSAALTAALGYSFEPLRC
jgi:hypothetical protein